MSDPEQREQESRESDVTKFEEERDADSEERHEAVERLEDEQQPGENEP